MRLLDDSEISTFRSDGVVHIRNAVERELVDSILHSVQGLMDSPGRFGGSTTPGSQGMFFQDRYLHPIRSDFRSYATDCGLARTAAQATASSQMRLYYDHVFVKEPGTQEPLPGIKTDHIGQLTEPRFVHVARFH